MKQPTPHARPRKPSRARAFTLTEVLIALALVAMLLVGISRIFSITSTTITSGQALAKAMRSQKAIQTQLSNDFVGVGDIGRPDYQSGMMPLINTLDADYASPFIAISNFRIAAYKNQADFAADVVQPVDSATMSATIYGQRSAAIRGIDLNGNGVETDAGESIPLYSYGERNFRTDTLSFFARGAFRSQTGSTGYADGIKSNEAWIWYGHLRTFNSNAALINNAAGGYGCPGDLLTTGASAGPNVNNRFADQFRLGRFAMLLVEPIDHKYQEQQRASTTIQDYATVVENGDLSKPVYFIKRNWGNPVTTATSSMIPINMQAPIALYVPSAARNETVRFDDKTASTGSTSPATDTLEAALGRSDVGGAGLKVLRQRANYVESSFPTTWWSNIAVNWADRMDVNPFPTRPFAARGLAQQQSQIAEAASQFIVEFAGDFVGQNDDGTPKTTNPTQPDGVLDFCVVGGVKQTRWYGMPRDVDEDGVITGTAAAAATSPDVIPVRDVAGAGTYAFERRVTPPPTSGTNYLSVIAEPTTGSNANNTGYTCVWGPVDFAPIDVTEAGVIVKRRAVPQLIRVLVDVRDPRGTLKAPITQEYVFPIRVTAAIEPPR